MSFWTAIVSIVVILGLVSVVNSWLSSRRYDKKKLGALQTRVEELEDELRDRVETLERIVTDDRSELKRQLAELEHRT